MSEFGDLPWVFCTNGQNLSQYIGYGEEHNSKSRIWLQKAINDNELESNLMNYLLVINQFLQEKTAEGNERVAGIKSGTLSIAPTIIPTQYLSVLNVAKPHGLEL